MKKPHFTPLQTKILKMCLSDDDRVCSYYAKEIFKRINLADVFRKQIRIKLARLLKLEYDFVKDVVTKTEDRWIFNSDGQKVKVGIYRIDSNWKSQIRQLLDSSNEANRGN